MATVIRVWQIANDKLSELPELPPQQFGVLEQSLEVWLESQPDAVQDNLLWIGRQVQTESGPLDLLGITVDGRLVVVELKRDRAPRETVAQALDYASWLATKSAADISAIAGSYLKKPLEAAFQERFGQALELSEAAPTVLVVASRLDAATERMIHFLGRRFGMDINGLIFRFIQDGNGSQHLIRTLVAEEHITLTPDSHRVPIENLLAQAGERGARPIVDALRRLGEFLWEESVRTYRGSFRYWGPGRMLCGVNVAGYWGAPLGTLDVWVAHGGLAQSGGRDEQEIVAALENRFEVVKTYQGSHQRIVRIKSVADAAALVAEMKTWSGQGNEISAEGALVLT